MTYTNAVEIDDLVVRFSDHAAVDGLTLQVPRGEIMAVLGPNGAGKTTTVAVLSTLLRPTSGRVRVAGYDVLGSPRAVRESISIAGQYASVDDRLTGRENLRLMARLAHLPRRRARALADETLERFDLADAGDRLVTTWSGGMRRRLDLAVSLLRHPELLILDEPTTGLDPRSRQQVWDVVRDVARDGTTVLLTTQYLEEADRLADRIAVLDRGRLAALGDAADLKSRIGQAYLEVRLGDDVARLPTDGTVADARRLLADGDLDASARWRLHEPSLDDVFLSLTGHTTEDR